MRFVVIIEPVSAQHLDKSLVLYLLFGDIRQIYSRCVALIFDVKTEFGLLNRRSKKVYVFHHQPPVSHHRIVACVFKRLHKDGLAGVCIVRGELSHLKCLSVESVFICHGEHLIRLQRCL